MRFIYVVPLIVISAFAFGRCSPIASSIDKYPMTVTDRQDPALQSASERSSVKTTSQVFVERLGSVEQNYKTVVVGSDSNEDPADADHELVLTHRRINEFKRKQVLVFPFEPIRSVMIFDLPASKLTHVSTEREQVTESENQSEKNSVMWKIGAKNIDDQTFRRLKEVRITFKEDVETDSTHAMRKKLGLSVLHETSDPEVDSESTN